jgi:hypothetical protein
LFLALIFLAALLSVAWAYDSQGLVGTVVGKVTNGTPGGAISSDATVTLHVFSGMEEMNVYTTTLTPGRAYRFQDVSFDQGETVVARTVYEGVTYFSEFVTVESEDQEVSLPITVYETTDDPGDVAVAQLHVFVERSGERLQVGQYCVIRNSGERTYVGSRRSGSSSPTTWAVRLPGDAENLRFDRGELGGRFVATGDGFADTRAVPPGEASVEASLTYELPYSEGLRVEQAFDVPVQSVVLVLPGGTLGLKGASLSSEGTVETQMGPAVSYRAGSLGAGEVLSFTVVPREATVSGTQRTSQSDELAVGIAVLAVAGVTAYWLWRSPLPGSVPPQARSAVEAIAALDRDFERGRVSEKVYRKRRRSLKQRLRGLLSG